MFWDCNIPVVVALEVWPLRAFQATLRAEGCGHTRRCAWSGVTVAAHAFPLYHQCELIYFCFITSVASLIFLLSDIAMVFWMRQMGCCTAQQWFAVNGQRCVESDVQVGVFRKRNIFLKSVNGFLRAF